MSQSDEARGGEKPQAGKPSLPGILVARIMRDFAQRTGLDPEHPQPRRYLWTDAFAVCNFLELHRLTGDDSWLELALRLVGQVHAILGRHRGDDPRSGWLSGLGEDEGELHPTVGGLRIGKREPERGSDEPFDERREWERDGQYYHYLTKWMHALSRVGQVTGDGGYTRWALELAKTAHEKFSYLPAGGGGKRLYWKMSIDLSHPQVPSAGQHDPLDGLVTCCELAAAAPAADPHAPSLEPQIAELAAMCQGGQWGTDDPLGIGGLLFDAGRIGQLEAAGAWPVAGVLEQTLHAALAGIELFAAEGTLEQPASHRLAFRELGLSLGLRSAWRLQALLERHPGLDREGGSLAGHLEALREYQSVGERIESFWLEDGSRSVSSWNEHREINMVMLATSLAPDCFLKA